MLITFNKKSSVNEYFFSCSYLDDDNEYIIGESEDKTIFQTKQKRKEKFACKNN